MTQSNDTRQAPSAHATTHAVPSYAQIVSMCQEDDNPHKDPHEALRRVRPSTILSTSSSSSKAKQTPHLSTPSQMLPDALHAAEYHLAIALFDFQGDADAAELSFVQDDVILLAFIDNDDGWYEGYSCGPVSRLLQAADPVDERQSVVFQLSDRSLISAEAASLWLQRFSSSVRDQGEIGLVPASYVQIIASDSLSIVPLKRQEPDILEEDPFSPTGNTTVAATSNGILPLLERKRTLNRLSPFVTSGAEEFILTGATRSKPAAPAAATSKKGWRSLFGGWFASNKLTKSDELSLSNEIHHITAGPRWAAPTHGTRYISVSVRNPAQHIAWAGIQQWTTFEVESSTINLPLSPSETPAASTVIVHRRYNHFYALYAYLSQKFPVLLVPPIPAKQFSGRFREEFLQRRMRALARWLSRVVRHPVLSNTDAVNLFFTAGAGQKADACAEILEAGMRKLGLAPMLGLKHRQLATETYHASSATAMDVDQLHTDGWASGVGVHTTYMLVEKEIQGPSFFKYVYHPEFNIAPDASSGTASRTSLNTMDEMLMDSVSGDIETLQTMSEFVHKTALNSQLVAKSMSKYNHLLVNNVRREMRRVGTGLHRLVQSSTGPSDRSASLAVSPSDEPPNNNSTPPVAVWCHHGPTCRSCPHLTHALEAMATAMTSLSDIYTDHGVSALIPLIEQLGDWTEHVESRAAHLLSVHQGAARIGHWIARKSKKHRSTALQTQRPLSQDSANSSTLSSMAAEDDTSADAVVPFNEKQAQIQEARLHVLSRLQTVFNTTHAELDHWFHQERAFEFAEMAEHWIEAELAMLEQCMTVVQGCHRIVKTSVQRMHEAERI